jgi:hypothetical protein
MDGLRSWEAQSFDRRERAGVEVGIAEIAGAIGEGALHRFRSSVNLVSRSKPTFSRTFKAEHLDDDAPRAAHGNHP